MAAPTTQIKYVVSNQGQGLVFFDGSDLAYNFKTNQWTSVPAYNGLRMFTINDSSSIIGLVRFSSGSVDLQSQSSSGVAQTATITTGAVDANQGGRTVVTGVRPLANGGTHTVRVGVQDNVGDAVTWSTSTSPNSRTGMANFRAEGRYVRIENTITGGFTTAMGADIEFSPRGKV